MSLNVIGLSLGNGKEMKFQIPPKNKEEFFVSFENNNEEISYWDIEEWKEDPSSVLGAIFSQITNGNIDVHSESEYGDDLYLELSNEKMIHFNEYSSENPGLNYIKVYDIIKDKPGIPRRDVELKSFSMNDFKTDPKGSMERLMSYMTANNPDAYMVEGKVAVMRYRDDMLVYDIKSEIGREEMSSQFKVSNEHVKKISSVLENGGTLVGDMEILSELRDAMYNERYQERTVRGKSIFIEKDMSEEVFMTVKNALESKQSIFVSYKDGWEYYPTDESEKNAYCSDDGLAHIYELGITTGEKPVIIAMEQGENWGSQFMSSGIKEIVTSESIKELIDKFVEYEVESAVERAEKEIRNELGTIINETIEGYDKVKNGENYPTIKTELEH